jgi:nitrite reductase (NADH) small subunit
VTEVYVGTVSDFDDDVRKGLVIEGREVFVFRRGERFYAFENRCSHAGGPVGEGTIIGRVKAVLGPGKEVLREEFSETDLQIVCPWHGYEYNIETGKCAADKRLGLRRYTVVERGEGVYVSA